MLDEKFRAQKLLLFAFFSTPLSPEHGALIERRTLHTWGLHVGKVTTIEDRHTDSQTESIFTHSNKYYVIIERRNEETSFVRRLLVV